MQKVIVGVGVAWLLVVAASINLVYSQPAALTGTAETSTVRLGRDLSLTLGLDIWPNQWETTRLLSGGHIESLTAFGVGFIPTATLVYKRFFLSISYMRTNEYDFGTSTEFTPGSGCTITDVQNNVFTTPCAVLTENKFTASRQEGDFTVGYFPLDWLGVAIGYKGVFQHFEQETRNVFPPQLVTPVTPSSSDTRYNGLIFGVLGSARIDDRFTLIGNAFGGYLFTSCSPSCPEFGHASYAASKVVLRYAPTPQVALTLGYRVQVLNTSIDTSTLNTTLGVNLDLGHSIDLTHGPIIGVNYRF